MRFSLRIFLGFFLLVGLMAVLVFEVLRAEVRPVVRQSVEEVLVDTSQLLAELVRDDLVAGRIDEGRFSRAFDRLGARDPTALIRDIEKRRVELRVYVVDAQGIVVYDSTGRDIGVDYSHWRDVFLTLRGRYGARTTQEDPGDELSSWMYVAAPVVADGRIIGVVTIGKPARSVAPYVIRAQEKLLYGGALVLLVALALGALFSWWLSHGIGQLTAYAYAVRDGVRTSVPSFFANRELRELAMALEEMRTSLDDKEYIEEYVLGLTHELKSPLTGITASAELLHDELPAVERHRFAGHIHAEARRLLAIVERLLELVRLEQRLVPPVAEHCAVDDILNAVRQALLPQAGVIDIRVVPAPGLFVRGERFLIEQAARNLAQNAIEFSSPGGSIQLSAKLEDGQVCIAVANDGEHIPDWALIRVFERFYSLPRAGGRKGSGLGLPLVRSIAALHGGSVRLDNTATGVCALLRLPQG